MEGWIKLHRKIVDNPYYFSEPFTRSQAWVDLLILANHKVGYFYKRGIKVTVEIGQVGYDLDSLGKRQKWSRGKVERFINELETDKQIVRQKTNVTTLLSIVNYKSYQTDSKAESKPNSKADGQQTVKQTEANKNDKNEENEKNNKPTESEFLEYCKTIKEITYSSLEFSLKSKYASWLANGWKDGNDKKINNWKTKILNTIPYLQPNKVTSQSERGMVR